MKTNLYLTFFFLISFLSETSAQELKLASIFANHMVIQREINSPVWGKATPGNTVKVEFAGYTTIATVGTDSSWMARMPVLQAGGPYEMTVQNGSRNIKIQDVMVGEVWLASGQSNMEWSVGMGVGSNTENEIATSTYPNIRYYTVPRKTSVVPLLDTEPGHWQKVTPESVKQLSAVAYFFARQLYSDKKVAVGIISSSWGATSAHAWISSEILATHPDFTELVKKQDKNPKNWDTAIKQCFINDQIRDSLAGAASEGLKKGVQTIGFKDSDWKIIDYPINMDKAGLSGFWGVSWFRKKFYLPAEMKGKKAKISLFARAREVVVYINGSVVARKTNPENEITIDIQVRILNKGENLMAIRLYQHWGIGLIGNEKTKPVLSSNSKNFTLLLDGEWKSSGRIEPPLPQMQGYYNQYSVQYNARIAPIIPYGIRGAIWYQGEGNASKAYQYRTLFPLVIQDWRTRWGQGYFPFLFVQLANHKEKKTEPSDDEFAELREAQTLTLNQPKTGMACAIDIGDVMDIHPRNKLYVGKRLYLAARHVAYGENNVSSGPMYESMKVEGEKIRISFSSVGTGIIVKNSERLKGFSISGYDRKFVWADAVIEGNSVLVSSEKVANPVAVRYSWEINPDGNLYNKEGLPTVPFRTDNFKMITE